MMFRYLRELVLHVRALRDESATTLAYTREQHAKQQRKIEKLYEQWQQKANAVTEIACQIEKDARQYTEAKNELHNKTEARIRQLRQEAARHSQWLNDRHCRQQGELQHQLALAHDDCEAVEEQLEVEGA